MPVHDAPPPKPSPPPDPPTSALPFFKDPASLGYVAIAFTIVGIIALVLMR